MAGPVVHRPTQRGSCVLKQGKQDRTHRPNSAASDGDGPPHWLLFGCRGQVLAEVCETQGDYAASKEYASHALELATLLADKQLEMMANLAKGNACSAELAGKIL